MYFKGVFVSLMLSLPLLSQEPSAFNAGAIEPKKSEREITQEKLFNLSSQMKSVNESQEGLKSVFEGQIKRIQDLSNRINAISDDNNASITELKTDVNSNFEIQNKNIENIKNSIAELSKLINENNVNIKQSIAELQKQIDDINTTISPKSVNNTDDINAKKVDDGNKTSTQEVPISNNNLQKKDTPKKDIVKSNNNDFKNKSLAEIFKDGETYLSNKEYELADKYIQFAVKGNYKPARGNFLLGEIAFASQKYEDAIYYYKISATRYDKADYMPTLMLNSAKSFIAIKEEENANRFLKTLIELYPSSNEAKEANKLLK